MQVLKSTYETTLYETKMVDTCHYTFVQTHRIIRHQEQTQDVNHGLWVMVTCRFMDCNECPTLVGMLIKGEEGGFGKPPYPPPNFAVNLELLDR